MCKEAQIFERLSIKINYYLLNGIHSRNMLTKKKLMKGAKKVISKDYKNNKNEVAYASKGKET